MSEFMAWEKVKRWIKEASNKNTLSVLPTHIHIICVKHIIYVYNK